MQSINCLASSSRPATTGRLLLVRTSVQCGPLVFCAAHHAVPLSHGNEVSQNRLVIRLMTSANLTSSTRGRTRQTMSYLWVTVGSALGGFMRFAIGRLMLFFDV